MAEVVEVVARPDAAAAASPDTPQRFHALEFPAWHGSQVMRYLTRHFGALSALGFGHLKRMKKANLPAHLVAIVLPVEEDDAEGDAALPESVIQHKEEMETQFGGRLTLVEALKFPPRTRALWEEHSPRWPLVFHASVLPEIQAPPPITDDEQREMEVHMRAAVAIGRSFASTVNAPSCARGCVIVDPEALERVATSDSAVGDAFLPIWHPAMAAVDAVATRDRQKELDGHQHELASAPKRSRREEDASSSLSSDASSVELRDERESYLCTGYDVYVDREPCAMCAMALVHSRARRVVFGERNERDGVLAGDVRLHTLQSLNHRYRVFHLVAAGAGESKEESD